MKLRVKEASEAATIDNFWQIVACYGQVEVCAQVEEHLIHFFTSVVSVETKRF